MDCDDTLEALRANTAPNEHVLAHVKSCELCREFVEDGGAAGRALKEADLELEPDLDSVRQLVAEDSGPLSTLRALPTPTRVGLGIFCACLTAVGVGLSAPRADFGVYPKARLGMALLALLLVGVAAIRLALRPTYLPRRGAWGWALALGLTLPVLLATLPAAHADHPLSLEGAGADLVPRAAACFFFGLLTASPLLLLLWSMSRVIWREKFLLAAVAAGLAAIAALEVHCPVTGYAHLLLGHTTVVLGLVGAVLLLWSRRHPSR